MFRRGKASPAKFIPKVLPSEDEQRRGNTDWSRLGSDNIALPDPPSTIDTSDMGPAPLMVTKGKYGRPRKSGMIGDGDAGDRSIAYNEAVQQYQPEKAKGWWDRYVKPALVGAGLGFLAGGPGGAIGGGVANTLRSAFDPSAPNKDWRRRELNQSGGEVAGVYAQRKAADDDIQRQANLGKTVADTQLAVGRTKALSKQSPATIHKGETIENGVKYQTEFDPATKAWKKSIGEDGKPISLGRTTEQPTKTMRDVNGVTLNLTDDQYRQHLDVLEQARATRENRDYSRNKDTTEAQFTNQQLQTNIQAAKDEQAKVEQALKDTAPTIETVDEFTGDKKTTPNPVYTKLESRRDGLIDDQRRWGGQMKAEPQTKPDARKGTLNFGKWKKEHPNEDGDAWLREMKAKYPNAVIIN